jgi:hypothetical protein
MILGALFPLEARAMSFEHACFVSYRHPDAQGEFAARFINDLSGALDSELGVWMKERSFVDRRGQRPGAFFDATLATALCKSVCMVVVYTPNYFDADHLYCAREYRAMEFLEQKRLARLPEDHRHLGLIIPVILRGEEKDLPPAIRYRQVVHYFKNYTLCERKIAYNSKYVKKICEIVEVINARKKVLAPWSDELTCDCSNFTFPTEEHVKDWLQKVSNSTPSVSKRDFPFRSGT